MKIIFGKTVGTSMERIFKQMSVESVHHALSLPFTISINHLSFAVAIQPSIILPIVPMWYNDWYCNLAQTAAKSKYRGIKANIKHRACVKGLPCQQD